MEEKTVRFSVNRYSLEFKHLICKEHIEQGTRLNELKRKYNLSSHSLIHEWLRVLNYLPSNFKVSSNIVEIGIENHSQPAMSLLPTSKEKIDSQTQDSSEVVRLKKELEDAKILAEGYNRMIEIAEHEYKISIRKKPNTK